MNEVVLSGSEFLKFRNKLSNLEIDYSVSTESSYCFKCEDSTDSIIAEVLLDRISTYSDLPKLNSVATLTVLVYFKNNKEV